MPDKTYSRGAIRFDINIVVNAPDPPEERVYDVSCAPPPGGTITRYNAPAQAGPTFQPGFFQQSEQARVLAFAANAGEALTLPTLLSALGTACGFQTLTFDFSEIPGGWDAPVPCFDTSVRCHVNGQTWEVTAKTTRDMTHGSETLPTGDTVATFRIFQPTSYHFVRRYTWNPACCAGTARIHDPDYSATLPKTTWVLPEGWKLGPGYKWKLDWGYPWYPPPAPDEPGTGGEGH